MSDVTDWSDLSKMMESADAAQTSSKDDKDKVKPSSESSQPKKESDDKPPAASKPSDLTKGTHRWQLAVIDIFLPNTYNLEFFYSYC